MYQKVLLLNEKMDSTLFDIEKLKELNINIIEDDFTAIENEMIRHNVVKLAFYIFSTLLNK